MQDFDIVFRLKRLLADIFFSKYNIEIEDIEKNISFESPNESVHGDLATNICLRFSKQINKKPISIAQEVVESISQKLPNSVEKVKVASPGFINIYLKNDWYYKELAKIIADFSEYIKLDLLKEKKILIEHTAVNPNKAMHVGHIRNSILGDVLMRLCKKAGATVKVENYLDDTGIQAAHIVNAIKKYGDQPKEDTRKFDHYCWDLYSKILKDYNAPDGEKLKDSLQTILKVLEKGEGPLFNFAFDIIKRIVKCQIETLEEFEIFCDFLFSEGVILKSNLWENTLDKLKETGLVVYEKDGPNKNCLVIKNLDLPNKEQLINSDKVLVSSKDNILYTSKDIAHHFWKFGIESANILFSKFLLQKNGKPLYISVLHGEKKPEFEVFDISYAVVDVSQSYNFDIIKAIFRKLGYLKQEDNLHHVAYGLVSLSKDTVLDLGIKVKEDKKSYSMSGRKGLGIKADDLLIRMIQKVEEKRKQENIENNKDLIDSKKIASGAIRAYMFKFNIFNNIVFDINQALQITGDSGPYMQYTHARIKGIIRKTGKFDFSKCNLTLLREKEELILIKRIIDYKSVLNKAVKAINPCHIYNYLIELCQEFNSFYNAHSIIKSKSDIKQARLGLIITVANIIADGLDILGIQAPDNM
jgi:arginyl-tRNA synthetase